ncbi:MAG: CPBP family intramembrane metalloprotease [Flavobacteriaceae bacterium]|nr:CPBP family intramembrane metalloprotease [Bacteroidia bacterium]MBT8287788.1 CPBP family intramembrane metalloprotease [Bacteroidia bacterium]NNF75426.1 CPBP family intramembrane metalloprotease [Flavobacteriaceae bacterium]NNK72830.1 CPBP family intramembrane metalloprotease [Flavobacteriaceae bacterium]
MNAKPKFLKSIIAILVIVLIPYGVFLAFRIGQQGVFSAQDMIRYPLVFGGISILIVLLIKRYFLQEPLSDFNKTGGSWSNDLKWGLLLTAFYFILFALERISLRSLLNSPSNMELLGLMLEMREKPILLLLWFGPVLWIGVAFYEELIRVFLLSSLWKFSKNLRWILAVILITSLIMGFVHWNQGSYGIVTITIKSFVACWFFYKKRRLMPLVYAHVLYDGLQVAQLLLTYPQD